MESMRAEAAVFVVSCLCIQFAMASDIKPIGPSTDATRDESVSKQHKTDSLTILMLLALLLLTILTVWLFKHRRFRFVHETGLSMIYGLIVGAIIRYTSVPSKEAPGAHAVILNGTYYASSPPDNLFVDLPTSQNVTTNRTVKYHAAGIVSSTQREPLIEQTVTFDPEIFFNVILPVIIFEAGYSMKRRHFFKNLGAIMTYAFLGTTISTVVVGGITYGLTRLMPDISSSFYFTTCLFFGALISATDPVTVLAIFNDLNVEVDLYAIVFGESVLNDAVAIVLSQSVEAYGDLESDSPLSPGGNGTASVTSTSSFNASAFFSALGNFAKVFAGAFAIGSVMGCCTALLTKYTKLKDFPLLESAMFFLMSYGAFQAAEAAGLTGIVAVLFCGICQAHYTYNNLSAESKLRTKQLFELFNFLAENFVFLYIGVSIFTLDQQKWHAGFIFSTFLAIIVARALHIYPLSFLLNLGRKNKIRGNIQHMMMFSGLRGAIAFALSIRNTGSEARQMMVSATMMVILVTVILCGGFTTPVLQWLQIRVGMDEEHAEGQGESVRAAIANQRRYKTMGSTGDDSGSQPQEGSAVEEPPPEPAKGGKAWLVLKWHHFDVKFMKPFLTNSRPTLMETLPSCCQGLARLLTTDEQMMGEGEVKKDDDSDTDMIIDHGQLNISITPGSTPPPPSNNAAQETDVKQELQMAEVELHSDDRPLTP